MPIYVDDLVNWGEPEKNDKGQVIKDNGRRCHCWADTEIELIAFARQLHIPMRWKHTSFSYILRRNWPHFDLDVRWRAKAISAGAQPTSLRAYLSRQMESK